MDRLILSEELIITKVSPTSGVESEGIHQEENGDGTNWSLDIEPVYLTGRNRIDELNSSPTVGTSCQDVVNCCYQSVSPATLCIATLSPKGEEPDSTTWDNPIGSNRPEKSSFPKTTRLLGGIEPSPTESIDADVSPLVDESLPLGRPSKRDRERGKGTGKRRGKRGGGSELKPPSSETREDGDLQINKEEKEELIEDLDVLFPKIEPVPGNVVYPCPTCGLTFSTLAYVQQHSKWCRGSRSRSNGKGGGTTVGGSANGLRPRVKGEEREGGMEEREERMKGEAKERGTKKYPCSVCPYSTDVSSHLTAHLRRHTGERPFACSLCPYRAAEACTLARHRLAHSGARPYACPLCPHRAAFAGDLQKHLRRHTGERPFACLECPYRAARPGSLKEHVLSQHESRSFSCSLCPWSGSGPSQLRKHCRTVHRGGGAAGGGGPARSGSGRPGASGGRASPPRREAPPDVSGPPPGKLFPCYLCRHDSSELRDLTRHIQTSHPQLVSLYKPNDD